MAKKVTKKRLSKQQRQCRMFDKIDEAVALEITVREDKEALIKRAFPAGTADPAGLENAMVFGHEGERLRVVSTNSGMSRPVHYKDLPGYAAYKTAT